MDTSVLQEFKEQLQREHDRILAELKTIARPRSGPDDTSGEEWDVAYPKFEQDESGSHADRDGEEDEVEEYEERVGAASSLESQLLSIAHALQRIEHHTYGICKTCHNPIPLDRLRANPAAEYDIAHELENQV